MTPAPQPKGRCDHEPVCWIHNLLKTPCKHKKCTYDTRSRPHTPAPEEKPCDHCDFQEIGARQAAAVMEAVKKERARILEELDDIRHVESKEEFFVTVYLFEVRKIVRGQGVREGWRKE